MKILAAVMSAALTAANLVILQKLIDSIVAASGRNFSFQIPVWAVLLVTSEFLSSNRNHFGTLIDLSLERGLNRYLPERIVEKCRTISYASFENKEKQDILKRVNEQPVAKIMYIFNLACAVLSDLLSVFSLTFLFLTISLLLPVFFAAAMLLVARLTFLASGLMEDLFFEQTVSERKMEYFRSLFLDRHSLAELKFFHAIDHIKGRWEKCADSVLRDRLAATMRSQRYFAMSCGVLVIWVALVTAVLIGRLSGGHITIGVFVSMVSSSFTVLDLGNQIARNLADFSRKALEVRYLKLFFNLPDEENRDAGIPKNTCIEFRHVSFQYPGTERMVLKDVSFRIEPGESVAIVGENGAGKSTLIKLLCGLYPPTQGSVTIGGMEVSRISQEVLSRIIRVVFQDFQDYWFSLRENVTLGNRELKHHDTEIREALENVNFSGIASLDMPLGKLEEHAADLSRGQWQRLAIARACFADNKQSLMIFDEPSASLDPIAESRMYAMIYGLLKGRSCILISHRLASAKMADRILVFKQGMLSEDGTHEELIKQGGDYCKMWSAQSSWY
ncbi:MAG TPA: ABC transporter ATP-binding protein/permease [Candidatus Eisenbergiella merdipullorum]|uniref:ABC transporter ATP-binding protein/permease n=1 Tax=Candidatus Eisenbergiella merdipullorum TaxID=2838553 RepID=A0A9D2KYQ7_9FIRM|nr:ABC transporter ATP-binding protein/permease [Candidatus Eisenbergiella merdipullorum]